MRIILLLIALLPVCCAAQTTIRGVVRDSKTGEPVPFASIGLFRQNIGTNADETGNFSLLSRTDILNDTLVISGLGFETKMFSLRGQPTQLHIGLQQCIHTLSEVVFTGRQSLKSDTLNNFRERVASFQQPNERQNQIAQLFEASTAPSTLIALEVYTGLGVFYERPSSFRIRIYAVDSLTGLPSYDLCQQPIEVQEQKRRTWIDLAPYNITLPETGFYIAVEVLKIRANEYSLNAFQQEYGPAPDSNGNIIIPEQMYIPHVGLINTPDDRRHKALFLQPNGGWLPILHNDKSNTAAIRAIVRHY